MLWLSNSSFHELWRQLTTTNYAHLRLRATVAFVDKKSLKQLCRPHISVANCSGEFCHTDGFLKALRS